MKRRPVQDPVPSTGAGYIDEYNRSHTGVEVQVLPKLDNLELPEHLQQEKPTAADKPPVEMKRRFMETHVLEAQLSNPIQPSNTIAVEAWQDEELRRGTGKKPPIGDAYDLDTRLKIPERLENWNLGLNIFKVAAGISIAFVIWVISYKVFFN